MSAITDAPPAVWGKEEIGSLKSDYSELRGTLNEAVTKYNPTPGKTRLPKWAIKPSKLVIDLPDAICCRHWTHWLHPCPS